MSSKRLNKTQKNIIVKAILADCPNVDYATQGRKLVMEDAINQLPEPLKEYTTFLARVYCTVNGYSVFSVRVPNNEYSPSTKLRKKIEQLHNKYQEQKQDRDNIEVTVTAILNSCNTLKQAREALPKNLHKYLPSEEDAPLTATALVSAEMVKKLETIGIKR